MADGSKTRTDETKVGTDLVTCPVDKCWVTHRFIETLQSRVEGLSVLARRKEYLRLQHLAGRHELRR